MVIATTYALGAMAHSNGSEALVIVGQSADPGARGGREWCGRSGPIDGKVLWQPNLGKWGAAVTWAPGNLSQHSRELQPWEGNLVTGTLGSYISCGQCQQSVWVLGSEGYKCPWW